ncbi:hypothetical protein [Nonomuraea wenchangensis]|uniref:hypothetical protein n=1 Tax=Nonomuraea wenchangensis TaxID=568860 RepID=UPI00331737E6
MPGELPPLPFPEAANHSAMAMDAVKTPREPEATDQVITDRPWYTLWISPQGHEVIMTPAGPVIYRWIYPALEMSPLPMHTEGKLAKAAAQTRDAKAAASEQSRSEASWAR